MKRVSVVLFMVTVGMASAAASQHQKDSEQSRPSSFQPKPLDDEWSRWLVGEWEGSVESDVGTGKLWTKTDFGLNGQFFDLPS